MSSFVKAFSPIASIFGIGGDDSPAPAATAFAPPGPVKKLDVASAEQKKLRRGRLGRSTIKTGPLGLGSAETKAASILGG